MRFLTCGVTVLAGLLVAGAAATSAAPPDPWTLVPALPTACYGNQDDFSEVVRARIDTLGHEIERQVAVNEELAERFRTMDFKEKQRRMSEYMMQHPQETTKIMEAFQAAGSQQSNDTKLQAVQEQQNQRAALDASLARYRAAYEAMMDPFTRKISAVGEEFTLWDSPRKKPINAQADQEYGKLCAQWWKSGPFLTHLAEYKKTLVQGLPELQKEAQFMTTNFAWAGIPATAYRSTAQMEAVKHYMERAMEIFGKRDETVSHRQ
jgi:hypothetical protein